MTVFNIPLKPEAQTFGIQLAGAFYNLTLHWNTPAACWMLSIADADNAPLASNIPVVTGLDLLAPFRYLGIKGSLVTQTDNDPDTVPTFEDLGITGRIYFVSQD